MTLSEDNQSSIAGGGDVSLPSECPLMQCFRIADGYVTASNSTSQFSTIRCPSPWISHI
jgi:hypothetical protein